VGGQPAGIKPCPYVSEVKVQGKQSLLLSAGGNLGKNTSSLPEERCSRAKPISYSLNTNKKLNYYRLNYGKCGKWMYIIYHPPPRQKICEVLTVLRTRCRLLCCFHSMPTALIKHIRSNGRRSAMLRATQCH